MAVRMEKTIATVLHEAYVRQLEVTMDALSEGPEGLYGLGGFLSAATSFR